jgi:hypothetical protein
MSSMAPIGGNKQEHPFVLHWSITWKLGIRFRSYTVHLAVLTRDGMPLMLEYAETDDERK